MKEQCSGLTVETTGSSVQMSMSHPVRVSLSFRGIRATKWEPGVSWDACCSGRDLNSLKLVKVRLSGETPCLKRLLGPRPRRSPPVPFSTRCQLTGVLWGFSTV